MYKYFNFLSLLLATIAYQSCSTEISKSKTILNDDDRIKRAYFALLNHGNSSTGHNFIEISSDSSAVITDEALRNFLPNTDFQQLTIFNASEYEYNTGHIPIIAACSTTDSNDVRLLLPLDYAKSSSNFFDLFYHLPINGREAFCKSIASLLLKTTVFHSINCSKKISDLHQSVKSTDTAFIVITNWKQDCEDINIPSREKYIEHLSKSTFFYFTGNEIDSIDYREWR